MWGVSCVEAFSARGTTESYRREITAEDEEERLTWLGTSIALSARDKDTASCVDRPSKYGTFFSIASKPCPPEKTGEIVPYVSSRPKGKECRNKLKMGIDQLNLCLLRARILTAPRTIHEKRLSSLAVRRSLCVGLRRLKLSENQEVHAQSILT